MQLIAGLDLTAGPAKTNPGRLPPLHQVVSLLMTIFALPAHHQAKIGIQFMDRHLLLYTSVIVISLKKQQTKGDGVFRPYLLRRRAPAPGRSSSPISVRINLTR